MKVRCTLGFAKLMSTKTNLFSPLFAEPILAGAYFQDGWFNELAILSFKIVFYTPTSRMVGSRLIEIKEMSYIVIPFWSFRRAFFITSDASHPMSYGKEFMATLPEFEDFGWRNSSKCQAAPQPGQ